MDMLGLSDLQISLIAIGVVVVVGVILFNGMQQRRYRRSAQQAFARKYEDVLLGVDETVAEDGRIEPQLGSEVLQGFQSESRVESAALSIEAVELAATAQEESAAKSTMAVPLETVTPVKAKALAGAVVDYVVNLRGKGLIAASDLIEVLRRKFDFGKPVRWLGQRDVGASWEEITIEANEGKGGYVGLKGCLQLVDRSGPVSEVSLSEFCDMMQSFAAQVDAVADFPNIRKAHAQAISLDQFCVQVDVMVGINIISKDGGAFTGTKIRALAEASGFKLEKAGMFSYCDENGAALFSFNNYEVAPFLPDSIRTLTTHGVTFLLDVPRVKNGERVFEQMTHLAGIFSTTLGGLLVDDKRVALTDSGISKIKQHLSGIQVMLKEHNIPAGGEIALRLFA